MTSPHLPVISEEYPEVSSQHSSPRNLVVWTSILTLLLGGGGYLSWRMFVPNSGAPSAITQLTEISVKTLSLESRFIAEKSEYVAHLKSRRSVTLRPRVQGQVTQIWVEPGQPVNKGTILLQIDPNEQLAVLSSGNAAIAALLSAYPMLFPMGAGSASRQSLGTAVFGGTFVTTFPSLFVVPVLYIVIGKIQARVARPQLIHSVDERI